ncbi:MAG TPA: hypothetical protein QF624_10635 [Dehalococcoidia bacterium]|nr:hypothetical protein [Dehalococcoidia bacterium]
MGSFARKLLAVLVAAVALTILAVVPTPSDHVAACAFLRTPDAYEAEAERSTYLSTIDAASVDALFPGDPYFGIPTVEVGTRNSRADSTIRRVPSTLLKAIAWEESSLTMASRATHFESIGTALVTFDCGHGIMQVTTGMTIPLGLDSVPTSQQVNVATHYGYNIARGAVILVDKWNAAPQIRPVVGTDTESNPDLIENWYMATWSYNGFAGPGSLSSNHPLDPTFGAWPRPSYQCDGTQSRRRYPYQELVWGCIGSPPQQEGALLWQSIPASLPDLSQPQFAAPFSLGNWSFPYSAMDIPTPQPAHVDNPPTLTGSEGATVRGGPILDVEEREILIRLNGLPQEQRGSVTVTNPGAGLLSWAAETDDKWLIMEPSAGVALGVNVVCEPPNCDRAAEVTISVNPTLLPKANTIGSIRIVPANSEFPPWRVTVEVDADFEVAAPGTSRAN